MGTNYQKEMERIIEGIDKSNPPTLLLHSCCAPCSSACLEVLREHFRITVFYYNPNISSEPEYRKRVAEQKRLIEEYNLQISTGNFEGMHSSAAAKEITIIDGDYEPAAFFNAVRGYEKCPEGHERCFICYEMRLRKTAELAKEKGFDYFSTTLTISPLKRAEKLNEIGLQLQNEYAGNPLFLTSDFKKKDGYKRSIELSGKFSLYRQDFCGCIFSQRERMERNNSNGKVNESNL